MKIDLSIRNSKHYVIWTKLIWQKKKNVLQIMKIFFLQWYMHPTLKIVLILLLVQIA